MSQSGDHRIEPTGPEYGTRMSDGGAMTGARRILVRTDVDWASMNMERFAAQSNPNRPLAFIELIRRRGWLDAWAEAFTMDFFAYRSALQSISAAAHERVPNTTITVGLDDLGWLDEHGDEWIFPVDDDDVFAPGMAEIIGPVDDDVVLVLRPQYYVFNPKSEPGHLTVLDENRVMFTNNWGIRKSFVRELPEADVRELFARHSDGTRIVADALGRPGFAERSEWLRHDLSGPRVDWSTTPFSLAVKHPGSSTAMKNILFDAAPEDHVARLRAAMQLMTEPYDADPIGWARPAIDDYQALARACLG